MTQYEETLEQLIEFTRDDHLPEKKSFLDAAGYVTKQYIDSLTEQMPYIADMVSDEYYSNAINKIKDSSSCCNNSENHKQVHLITSSYKMCSVCKSDLGDWSK